jgi:hypothetical protein
VHRGSAATASAAVWRVLRRAPPSRRRGIGASEDEAAGREAERQRVTDATPGNRAPNELVCQVRWVPGRRGSSFCAAMTDTDGIERALAWSPRFDWRGPSPPEQTAEAQAALRELAKELRTSGWTPLRAKGTDLDERRWYARRFQRPPLVRRPVGTR